MKKLLILIVAIIGILWITSPLYALSTFQSVFIRLDRLQQNTTTSGLVCANPGTIGTENKLQITFPLDYTVSSNLADWSVDTDSLPSDATAWPGIDTATSVSGQTVTFPSGDLTVGTLYCFHWSRNALMVGSVLKEAHIATFNGSTSIDSADIGLTSSSSDQIQVSGTVASRYGDLDLNLSSSPSSDSRIYKNDEVTVNISFKSLLKFNAPFKLEASWEKGTFETSSGSLDVVDYVIGSATSTHHNIVPVVDLLNNTITWETDSLPFQESDTVSFKLKVKNDLLTDEKMKFKVKAQPTLTSTLYPASYISFTVDKPPPGPTATPTITPTPTATPSPTPKPLFFTNVGIKQITSTSISGQFQVSKPASYTIYYGTSTKHLTSKVTSLILGKTHTFAINDLKPNTYYYFRIEAHDTEKQWAVSDVFIFQTAEKDLELGVNEANIQLLWNKLLLNNTPQSTNTNANNTIVSSPHQPITIIVNVSDPASISELTAQFVQKDVLGISTYAEETPYAQTDLIELFPGVFSGELQTPEHLDQYRLVLHKKDTAHGLTFVNLPYLFYVSSPITIVDKASGTPIEKAAVTILKYEPSLLRFTPLSKSFGINQLTNEKGELAIALPSGKYAFEVSATKYDPARKESAMGISDYTLPTVHLAPVYSFSALVHYYFETFDDLTLFVSNSFTSIFFSHRAYDALFMIILLVLCLSVIIVILEKIGSLHHKIQSPHLRHIHRFSTDVATLLISSIINTSVIIIWILLCGFIYFQGVVASLPFVGLTIIVTIVWLKLHLSVTLKKLR